MSKWQKATKFHDPNASRKAASVTVSSRKLAKMNAVITEARLAATCISDWGCNHVTKNHPDLIKALGKLDGRKRR